MSDIVNEGRDNQDVPAAVDGDTANAATVEPTTDARDADQGTVGDVIKTLVCIDVELSEESGSEVVERNSTVKAETSAQEVVLIGYSVLQLSDDTATSVCKGQLFVKPTTTTPLTPYYTSVTGITQEDINGGVTLGEALDMLYKSLSAYLNDQKAVCVLTDGEKDVHEWLQKDAGKKSVILQDYLKRTLDLRNEFLKWRPETEDEITIPLMLKAIDVESAGEHHCGEKEVENMEAVVRAMVQGKHAFRYYSPAKTQVIRLRGLPYQVTEPELLEFLKTVSPDPESLHICRGAGKRPTGDAFVRIPPSKLEEAVKLSGQRVGHRYAEVFGTTELEFQDALKRSETIAEETAGLNNESLSKRGPFNMVIKLRGMPFTSTQQDIDAFFIGVTIPLSDIHICRRMDGRPNGDAYIQLQTQDDVERCLAFDRKNLGSRYVEVFRSTQSDMMTALGVGTNMGGAPGTSNADTLTLRMQGLPFTAKEGDVYQFFGGLQIAPNGIQFRMNRDGRPSGVAYATFTTQEQFEEAKKKHRSMMGSRYVELFPASSAEIPRDMGGFGQANFGNGGGFGYGQGGQRFPSTYGEYQQQRNAHRVQWEAYHRQAKAYYDQNGYGAQYQQFYEQQQQQLQQTDNQAMLYYKQRGMGGNNDYGIALVRMKGLPYTATPIEIADFFNGYNVGVDDVQIILNNDGRPSGDANVRFADNSSAQSAVTQLNRQRIGQRYVELFLEGRH